MCSTARERITMVVVIPVASAVLGYLVYRFVCRPAIDKHIQHQMRQADELIARADRILSHVEC